MPYDVEVTDEFLEWWRGLSEPERERVGGCVKRLIAYGVNLGYPYSSKVFSSRHGRMRELRVRGELPLRVFYAFDPRRVAILLIGGNKAGNPRFYDEYVPLADRLYDQYMAELRREGLI